MQFIPTEKVHWRIECDEPEHEAAKKWEQFAQLMLAEHAAFHEHFAVVANSYVMGSISPYRVEIIQGLADNVASRVGCKAVRVPASGGFPNGRMRSQMLEEGGYGRPSWPRTAVLNSTVFERSSRSEV